MKSFEEYVNKVRINNNWKSNSRIYGEAGELWSIDNITCQRCPSSLIKCKTNEKSIDLICNECQQKYQIKIH